MNIYLCTLISTQSTHTNGKQSLFMPWGGGGGRVGCWFGVDHMFSGVTVGGCIRHQKNT